MGITWWGMGMGGACPHYFMKWRGPRGKCLLPFMMENKHKKNIYFKKQNVIVLMQTFKNLTVLSSLS